MKNNSIEKFYQIVSNNETLQKQLGATSSLEDFASRAVELAQNQGYHFSVEEVKTAIAQKQSQVYELSDEQLLAVAGGKGGDGNADLAGDPDPDDDPLDFVPTFDDPLFHTVTDPAPEDDGFWAPRSTTLHLAEGSGGSGGNGGLSWS